MRDHLNDRPLSGDPEQRANDNRASREQSGLPPEEGMSDDANEPSGVADETSRESAGAARENVDHRAPDQRAY
jgi:hypothetical protein